MKKIIKKKSPLIKRILIKKNIRKNLKKNKTKNKKKQKVEKKNLLLKKKKKIPMKIISILKS